MTLLDPGVKTLFMTVDFWRYNNMVSESKEYPSASASPYGRSNSSIDRSSSQAIMVPV
jgi:hypothetical protein